MYKADIPLLISDYFCLKPDKKEISQRIKFGTSGHRGSPAGKSFNEDHILAVTKAICEYKKEHGFDEVFIGRDTHALSIPAEMTAVRVLAEENVKTVVSDDITPTPVISYTILENNKKGKKSDGIIITPSHNPPEDGGFKYNPPNGGPADTHITSEIETRANELLGGVKAADYESAVKKTEKRDLITPYVEDLKNVVDMDLIRKSTLKLAADPLGGSAISVYRKIKEIYGLKFDMKDAEVDYTFSFMPPDRDGKIRMDCSSPYAMANLLRLKECYDLAFANDTDADRHGIVTKDGLMNPNHYISVMVWYLFQNRNWPEHLKIGKTVVTSSMIDKIASYLGYEIYETPVGFKYFSEGLYEGWLGFGCEESAGASFLRFDGSVWSTDKDGITPSLLAVEITEKMKKSVSSIYKELEEKFGTSYYERMDAPANRVQKEILKNITPEEIKINRLGGEKIEKIITRAPGNGEPIGGVKIITKNAWVAFRPSGTEDIYKIYAESFISLQHLRSIQNEAAGLVEKIFKRSL
jgi:phosphoglucomutase